MKADMEAMKEQMATMMEAMMSMKKIMEVNAAVVSTVCRFWGGLDSPVWPQPNKSSNLGYGLPPFCASPEQARFPAVWFASELYSTQ